MLQGSEDQDRGASPKNQKSKCIPTPQSPVVTATRAREKDAGDFGMPAAGSLDSSWDFRVQRPTPQGTVGPSGFQTVFWKTPGRAYSASKACGMSLSAHECYFASLQVSASCPVSFRPGEAWRGTWRFPGRSPGTGKTLAGMASLQAVLG